jgi:hypothetical protein
MRPWLRKSTVKASACFSENGRVVAVGVLGVNVLGADSLGVNVGIIRTGVAGAAAVSVDVDVAVGLAFVGSPAVSW